MDDSGHNMSVNTQKGPSGVKVKPKKRSLVERELETSLTARITSPITNGEGANTSRYGRARRLKADSEFYDTDSAVAKVLKSPQFDKTPIKSPVTAYKMHASNSPVRMESPRTVTLESNLENQIANIYNTNISLSRFGSAEKIKLSPSPAKKYSKVYLRKDLIQTKDDDVTVTLIKNMFSPPRSGQKLSSHLNNVLERSSEKYNLYGEVSKPQNGYLDTSSVVKALDFDCKNKKKKKDGNNKEIKVKSLQVVPTNINKDAKIVPTNNTKDAKSTLIKDNNNMKDAKSTPMKDNNNMKDAKSTPMKDNNNMKDAKSTPMKDNNMKDAKSTPMKDNNNMKDAKSTPIKDNKDSKNALSKNEIFEMEANSLFQVGDLAWARMGTYPFWPCMVTREPPSEMFVKKKLFGKMQRDVIHVTFLADNGRRSWVLDSMLRKYQGLAEFEAARDNFTQESKRKDSRLHAAFFVSDKKLSLWHTAIEEADALQKEPKRFRVEVLNDMLSRHHFKYLSKSQKGSKITRTDSDVSLSESLFDSLFSEEDCKNEDSDRPRNKSKTKSLDVSEVVTACLDNMAAKTGMTNIKRQSHMDRWLQKAKSKTPEKLQSNHILSEKLVNDREDIQPIEKSAVNNNSKSKKKRLPKDIPLSQKPYHLRRSVIESQNLFSHQNEHDYSKIDKIDSVSTQTDIIVPADTTDSIILADTTICVIDKVESLCDKEKEVSDAITTSDANEKELTSDDPESKEELTVETQVPLLSVPTNTTNEQIEISDTNENPLPDDYPESKEELSVETQVSLLSEPMNTTKKQVEISDTDEKLLTDDTPESKEKLTVETQVPLLIEHPNTTKEQVEINDTNEKLLTDDYPKTKEEPTVETKVPLLIEPPNTTNEQIEIGDTNEKRLTDDYSESKGGPTVETQVPILSEPTNTTNELMEMSEIDEEDIESPPIDSPIDEMDEDEDDIESPPIDSPVGPSHHDIEEEKDVAVEIASSTNNLGTLIVKTDMPSDRTNDLHIIKTKSSDKRKDSNDSFHYCNYKKKEEKITETTDLTNQENVDSTEDPNGDVLKLLDEDLLNYERTKPIVCELKIKTSVIDKNNDNKKLLKVDDSSVIVGSSRSTKLDSCNKNKIIKSNSTIVDNIDGLIGDEVSTKQCNKIITTNNDTKKISENECEIHKTTKNNKMLPKDDSNYDSYASTDDEQPLSALINGKVNFNNRDTKSAIIIDIRGNNTECAKENGFLEIEVSEKQIEPDMISIISISSEVSNITEQASEPKKMAPITECKSAVVTKRILRKRKGVFPDSSDTESVSSAEDITLSDLKMIKDSEKAPDIKLCGLDDSQDSIANSTGERKLRLVLTDCFLSSNKHPSVKSLPRKDPDESPPAETAFKSKRKSSLRLRKSASHGDLSKEITSEIKPKDVEADTESIASTDSTGFTKCEDIGVEKKDTSIKIKTKEVDSDTISVASSNSTVSTKRKDKKSETKNMNDPEFLKYLELRQDALIDEHPELTHEEIVAYLFKTWQYEENLKSEQKKNDDIEQSNLVKGVGQDQPKKKKSVKTAKTVINIEKIIRRDIKVEKKDLNDVKPREMPRRKSTKPFYNENYFDIEDQIELFEIFKNNKKPIKTEIKEEPVAVVTTSKEPSPTECPIVPKVQVDTKEVIEIPDDDDDYYDEEEMYFEQLTKPKPNIFRGLTREKVCEMCEKTSNLVKCKQCNGMFHVECVNKETKVVEISVPSRGRKKKKKPRGRKPKNSLESNDDSHSDEKSHDHNVSEENLSMEELPEPVVIDDVDKFEEQLAAKMQEMINTAEVVDYDCYASDDGLDWERTVAGKCEIVDIKLKPREQPVVGDYTDFKCKSCQEHDTPVCFVCKSAVSPKTNMEKRQKCQVAHCNKFFHLECLEHWPQTQFASGEPSRNNKKIDEHFEAITCPRHVCHTCVCDDPRGCKTRFSGDKLARCVRCPATYHSFNKCLPAGTQILSASHIVCPRHYEHRPGKVPCHVNTGWCFICALGGTLICCEYCPTSFHADCLNIQPPEGGYMCEDCETGRLPLYGEMVWVKLGHYRWWPGIILHPSEIPDNILAVKHSLGEFVVRFFGQYDHYWVNRGRVFPFQEGDSGRLSGQKSKIDEAFTKAMEHAQRAFEILKNVEPNDEENQDIASSLLPPHYVKLKVNKPCGSLYGRKIDVEESSLTQCECDPNEIEPCGPYSHCLNRMLLTECGPTCRAGERCQNRAFERREYPKMVPYRTPHRGWGLKTLEDIKAGQFVIEYVGELIDEAEFQRRMRRMHEMRDENYYFLTLDKERMIDAGPKGNLARFMNHCCEPNCETQKWTVLGDIRVGLFAINDIPANTEVTFNYNLECAGIEKKQCMCGAKRCSGYIGAKPKQDDPQPKKNKPQTKRPYNKKRKNPAESPSTSKIVKPKRPLGRPLKPRELTDIEKDLLIIKNATNGLSSDSEASGQLSSLENDNKDLATEAKALKRKRVSFSNDDAICKVSDGPDVKKLKLDIDKVDEVGD